MERDKQLLQTNYSCMYEDKVYFVTEENHLLIELDINSMVARPVKKSPLKNRLESIFIVNRTLYMVDMAGKWIAETNLDNEEIFYYDINFNKKNVGNFACIISYGRFIYMFLKEDKVMGSFNIENKNFSIMRYGDREEGFVLDYGCLCGDNVYIFSGKKKKYYIYNISSANFTGKMEFPIKVASYALTHNNKIYILSGNKIYDIFNDYKVIAQIEDEILLSKICFAGDIIYFLPGKGEKIFMYDLQKSDSREINEYPNDYEYKIKPGWGKFVGRLEDSKYIYWNMRSNNYILRIDKLNGNINWLRPKVNNIDEIVDIVCSDTQNIIKEGACTLDNFINHIAGKHKAH